MRESISESWTIQIVAAFILLFVAFLALMISYSKCFKTKNEVLSIVEKYQGFTEGSGGSITIINDFITATNYKGTGRCDTTGSMIYGMPVGGTKLVKVNSGDNTRYRYCVRPQLVSDDTLVNYEIIMFYSFNIPAFGNIATFEVKGTTIDLSTKNCKTKFLGCTL